MNPDAMIMLGFVVFNALCVLFGVYIGHKLTLKGVAHVQPSGLQMADYMKVHSGVTEEQDPWADVPEEEPDPRSTEEKLAEKFAKTGLPEGSVDPKKFFGVDEEAPAGETGGMRPFAKADLSFVEKAATVGSHSANVTGFKEPAAPVVEETAEEGHDHGD